MKRIDQFSITVVFLQNPIEIIMEPILRFPERYTRELARVYGKTYGTCLFKENDNFYF